MFRVVGGLVGPVFPSLYCRVSPTSISGAPQTLARRRFEEGMAVEVYQNPVLGPPPLAPLHDAVSLGKHPWAHYSKI